MSDDTALPPDTPWWARLFIENLRGAWKLASVWWPALCAAAVEVYAQDAAAINEWVNDNVPKKWMPHLLAAAFAVSIAARVIKQSKSKE